MPGMYIHVYMYACMDVGTCVCRHSRNSTKETHYNDFRTERPTLRHRNNTRFNIGSTTSISKRCAAKFVTFHSPDGAIVLFSRVWLIGVAFTVGVLRILVMKCV